MRLLDEAERRATANFVAFLERLETWINPLVERVYAVLDHLHAHRAIDVLLYAPPTRAGSSCFSPSMRPT